jgi:hypothetical protein
MNDLERQLKNLSSISLSERDKDISREALKAFIATHPASRPIASPFMFAMRYSMAFVLLLVIAGGGVSYAAEGSIPGNLLYSVKIKVNEPARVAFTRDPQARANLEVELVERRLTDFAKASVLNEVDQETTDLVVESLNDRLANAHEDILALQTSGEGETDAHEASVDLYVTLSAHTEVLERLAVANPESAEGIGAVRKAVLDGIDTGDTARTALRETIEEDGAENAVGIAMVAQKAKVADDLEAITMSITADESVDADDRSEVEEALLMIEQVLEAASVKSEEGDKKGALELYEEVNEQVTRLKALIEADQSLGVDLINETSGE